MQRSNNNNKKLVIVIMTFMPLLVMFLLLLPSFCSTDRSRGHEKIAGTHSTNTISKNNDGTLSPRDNLRDDNDNTRIKRKKQPHQKIHKRKTDDNTNKRVHVKDNPPKKHDNNNNDSTENNADYNQPSCDAPLVDALGDDDHDYIVLGEDEPDYESPDVDIDNSDDIGIEKKTGNTSSKKKPYVGSSKKRSKNNDPYTGEPQDNNSYNNSQGDSPPPFKNISSNKQNKPLWLVILIILLIVFIIATIMSRGGVLVIWAGPLDQALVIIAAILFFIASLFSEPNTTLFYICALLMLGSFVFSIVSNFGHILNIILSILSKVFVFILVNFSIVVFIVVAFVYFMVTSAKHSRNYE